MGERPRKQKARKETKQNIAGSIVEPDARASGVVARSPSGVADSFQGARTCVATAYRSHGMVRHVPELPFRLGRWLWLVEVNGCSAQVSFLLLRNFFRRSTKKNSPPRSMNNRPCPPVPAHTSPQLPRRGKCGTPLARSAAATAPSLLLRRAGPFPLINSCPRGAPAHAARYLSTTWY